MTPPVAAVASAASAEQELFAAAVRCDDEFPASFRTCPLDPTTLIRLDERAEAILRTLALTDDSHGDDGDETGPHAAALARLDAKTTLIIDLLGQLLAGRDGSLTSQPLSWSRCGARLDHGEPAKPGDCGILSLQPAFWLPIRLELPVEVIASQPDHDRHRLWLRWLGMSDPVRNSLERLVFRLHRRAIARRQRNPSI